MSIESGSGVGGGGGSSVSSGGVGVAEAAPVVSAAPAIDTAPKASIDFSSWQHLENPSMPVAEKPVAPVAFKGHWKNIVEAVTSPREIKPPTKGLIPSVDLLDPSVFVVDNSDISKVVEAEKQVQPQEFHGQWKTIARAPQPVHEPPPPVFDVTQWQTVVQGKAEEIGGIPKSTISAKGESTNVLEAKEEITIRREEPIVSDKDSSIKEALALSVNESIQEDEKKLQDVREKLVSLQEELPKDSPAEKHEIQSEPHVTIAPVVETLIEESKGNTVDTIHIGKVTSVLVEGEQPQEAVAVLENAGVEKYRAEEVIKQAIADKVDEDGVQTYIANPSVAFEQIEARVRQVPSQQEETFVAPDGHVYTLARPISLPSELQEQIVSAEVGQKVHVEESSQNILDIALEEAPTQEIAHQLIGQQQEQVILHRGGFAQLMDIVEDKEAQNARNQTFTSAAKQAVVEQEEAVAQEEEESVFKRLGLIILEKIKLTDKHISGLVRNLPIQERKDGSLTNVLRIIGNMTTKWQVRRIPEIVKEHIAVMWQPEPITSRKAKESEIDEVLTGEKFSKEAVDFTVSDKLGIH